MNKPVLITGENCPSCSPARKRLIDLVGSNGFVEIKRLSKEFDTWANSLPVGSRKTFLPKTIPLIFYNFRFWDAGVFFKEHPKIA